MIQEDSGSNLTIGYNRSSSEGSRGRGMLEEYASTHEVWDSQRRVPCPLLSVLFAVRGDPFRDDLVSRRT